MGRVEAASGAPRPGQRYRIARPCTSSSAIGMNRYSSRSPARRAAGSKATSIRPKGSAKVPPRGTTSDPSFEAKAAVSAQLYRSAAIRRRGSNRPGATPVSFGEEEGIGVDGCRQVVVGLLGCLAVQEGQLGQGEEQVLVPLRRDHRPVQLGNGGLGMRVEGVEETALEEHVARRPARLARRDGAPGEVGLDDLGVDPDRADRPRAGRQGQAQGAEKRESAGMTRSPSRTGSRTPFNRVHRVPPALPRSRDIRGSPSRIRTEKRGSSLAALARSLIWLFALRTANGRERSMAPMSYASSSR